MARSSRSRWYDGQNNLLTLGPLIKSGGAGSVYHLSGGRVAKLYHDTIDKVYYQRKVAAMLTLAPQLPPIPGGGVIQLAWPLSPVLDGGKRFAGFIMPELDVKASIELEYMLQERQARAHQLPAGLGPRVSLAANLCALVAALHQQRHCVIDLKPVNLRFYRESLYVAMLDCDGFSIQGDKERFPASQFTAEYLAPEFQAHGRIPQAQEEYQDSFALAVILFQLLNFGIHPYSGRPLVEDLPTDLPGRIRRHVYPYGPGGSALAAPSPVSGHAQMPQDIRALFARAFAPDYGQRPSAQEWAQCLRRYALRSSDLLRVCAKNPQHHYFTGQACAACAREELLTKTAQAQKKAAPRRRRHTRARATPQRTANVAPRRAALRMPRMPAGPVGNRAIAGLAALSVVVPLLCAVLMSVIARNAGVDYSQFSGMLLSLREGSLPEQFAIGLLGALTALGAVVAVLLLVVLPFRLIRGRP